ncbi:MAG TPA: hypothetical protein VKE94_19420, partial [Gemmataceae bacterium]|nr:hypothetical protein [Gemmataceae bacterium]
DPFVTNESPSCLVIISDDVPEPSLEVRRLSMQRLFALSAVGLLLAGASSARASGCHGTKIDFLDTPKEAATQAKKEQKLVLVLHVSGHFEDPRLT